MKYLAKAVETKYWRPGENYAQIIVNSIKCKLRNGDIIVISEKAISTALGKIIDESEVKPGLLAKLLAGFWSRKIWGYILGPLCHLKSESIKRLRNFPIREGAAHKQLALNYVGFSQALRHGSEGGIDVSNVAYKYACLPLNDPERIANEILQAIGRKSGKKVAVMIVDSDKTYSFKGLHITPRPRPIKGIKCLGLLAYIIGRALKWKPRSTPLAIAGCNMSVEEALRIAAIANKARGHGAGRTAWDMAERFNVGLGEVTWEMLEKVKHHPIVVVRMKTDSVKQLKR